MTDTEQADRNPNAGKENTALSDEFLRRTRDPVLLARAARIFRAARARVDAKAADAEAAA